MTGFFITASGTDVGKTFVATGLVRHYIKQGVQAHAVKPVLSGFDTEALAECDSGRLLAAGGGDVTLENIEAITPWRFAAPLSPDMAARREDRTIDFEALVKFSHEATNHAGPVFIEGVGGVMVPLTETQTVLDWMKALALPTILVTGSYLGAISHALTAFDSLRRRTLSIAAIVVSESKDSTVPLEDTASTIAHFTARTPCVTLARAAHEHASAFTKLTEILDKYRP